MSTNTNPTPAAEQSFDAVYWAHQPPAVQALQKIADPARDAQAMALATQGYTIDVPIMVWGWDAFLVMTMRATFGYTWVPSALMPPVEMAPGVIQPGAIPYDPNNPPPGAIKVSTNLADYPAFKLPTPIPVPSAAPVSLVGAEVGAANYFQAFIAAQTKLTDGQAYSDDPRGTFTFHITKVATPFGQEVTAAWFTLN